MIEGLEILHRPEEEGPAILEDEPEEDEFDYIVDSYIFRDTAYYEFNAYFHKDPAPDLDEREREGLANLNLKQ